MDRCSITRLACGWVLSLFALALTLFAPQLRAADYVYDANGRLRAVTNSSGASATYNYDALGNMTSVGSVAAGQLAIFAFVPNRGPVGATVTLNGAGFAPTPAGNVVTVNGVAAAISTASATQIVFTVPPGATTGPIAVSVSANFATSNDTFTVEAIDQSPPSISGFTPTIAAAGNNVTVSGANLLPVAGQTIVRIGSRLVPPSSISSITTTQIVFAVPSDVGSGKVHVNTPYGSAISASDLVIVPPGTPVADVVNVVRLVPNGSAQPLSISPANKAGMIIFDASHPSMTVQFGAITTTAPSMSYFLYDSLNTLVTSAPLSTSQPTAHLPRLAPLGSYAILIRPGNYTATLDARLEIDGVLIADGAAVTTSTTGNSQSKRLTFTGVTNQALGLGWSGITLIPGTVNVFTTSVYTPAGALLMNDATCSPSLGCELDMLRLPLTGTYEVHIKPNGAAMTTATATLSNDSSGALVADTPLAVSAPRNGQNARLTFPGTANQQPGLQIANLSTVPSGRSVTASIYKLDGSLLSSFTANPTAFSKLSPLPSTGTYTVVVDPQYGATAAMQVTHKPGTALVLDGAGTIASTAAAGETVYLTFTGAAGQNLGLGISGLGFVPTSVLSLTTTVYRPDGTLLINAPGCSSAQSGCDVDLPNLPATGTYVVALTPLGSATMTFTATLSSDVTATLSPDTPQTLSLPRIGQDGRVTFSAAAGQQPGIQIANLTTVPSGRTVAATIYRPDGTTFSTFTASAPAGFSKLAPLPTSGTYTIVVDPLYGATATMQVTAKLGAALTLDGTPSAVATAAAGESALLTFAGTAGQNLGIGISGLTFAPTSVLHLVATVYRPDGALVVNNAGCMSSQGGCDLNLPNLPATGTYVVTLTPAGAATMSFTATLSSDVTASLSADTPYALSLPRNGQNGRLTFSGTVNQQPGLQIAGLTTVPAGRQVTATVYKPDGTSFASFNANPTAFSKLAPLPTTGTYTIVLDPQTGATASMQVTQKAGALLNLDGTATSTTTSAAGETAYLRFAGTAGQNLGLGITTLVLTPASGSTAVAVYRPDGNLFVSITGCTADCELNLANLPSTGTYVATVTPTAAVTMSLTATLSTDVTGALTLSTPSAISITRAGQNARYTYTGTSGQLLRLNWSSVSVTPTNRTLQVRVLRPDGTQHSISTVAHGAASGVDLASLPATGTYVVTVDPANAATAAITLTLAPR